MKRTLVIQTAFIGDLFLTIPLLRNLRRLFPEREIYLLCRRGLGEFFLEFGLADQVHEIEKGQKTSYRGVLQKLEAIDWESIYCPHESLRSALFVSRLWSLNKISFKKFWNLAFFQHRLSKLKHLPEALRVLSLLEVEDSLRIKAHFEEVKDFSWNKKDIHGKLPEIPLWASPEVGDLFERPQIKQKMLNIEKNFLMPLDLTSQNFIAVFPGSVWPTKRWTSSGFLEVAQKYLQDFPEQKILWMGGPGEEALCEELNKKLKNLRSCTLAGKLSVLETCLVLSKSRLVVGNDSGSSHMAAAMGVPVVSIFGPTVLSQGYRPWSQNSYVVERESLSCRPCGKHGGKTCPRKTHECMTHLSSEEVHAVIRRVLV